MKIKIDIKYLKFITLGFVLFTIIGTISHELGHIIVAKSLGYETALYYGSMNYYPKGYLDDKDVIAFKNLTKDYVNIEFKSNSVWNHLPLTFLLVLLHYLIDDFKNAIKYLKTFMKSIDKSENDYYKHVILYFSLLKNKKSHSIIRKKIPSEILLDFSDANTLFSDVGIPNCPNCESCDLFDDCITKNKINFIIRVMNKSKTNIINQNYFKKYKTNI